MSTGTGCERNVYWSEYDPKSGEFIDKRNKKLKKPKKEKLPEKSLTKALK